MQLFAAPQKSISKTPEPNIVGQRGRGSALSSTSRSLGGGAPSTGVSAEQVEGGAASSSIPKSEGVDTTSIEINAIETGVNSAIVDDNISPLITAELFNVAIFCF